MKIFRQYRFNCSSLGKFSDAFNIVEQFSKILSFKCSTVEFEFHDYTNLAEANGVSKVLIKHPEMKVYYVEEEIGNILVGKIKSNHKINYHDCDLIKYIVGKIPRPYNILSSTIKFGCEFENRELSIECCKDFGFGNKFNPISFKFLIYDSDSADIVFDESKYLNSIYTYLNVKKPLNLNVIEEFSALELKQQEYLNLKAQPIVKEIQNKLLSDEILPHKLTYKYEDEYKYNGLNSPNFSLSKAIKPYLKKYSYTLKEYSLAIYQYEKKDEFNHQLLLEFYFAPICKRLECYFHFKGLGYDKALSIQKIVPNTQEDIEKYLDNVFCGIDYFEKNFLPQLCDIYGSVPKWYKY